MSSDGFWRLRIAPELLPRARAPQAFLGLKPTSRRASSRFFSSHFFSSHFFSGLPWTQRRPPGELLIASSLLTSSLLTSSQAFLRLNADILESSGVSVSGSLTSMLQVKILHKILPIPSDLLPIASDSSHRRSHLDAASEDSSEDSSESFPFASYCYHLRSRLIASDGH